MITAILMLAMFQPQATGLNPTPPTGKLTMSAERTEKMTPDEVKRLTDARKALADAQDQMAKAKAATAGSTGPNKEADAARDQLIKAKAGLKGTTDSIELAHHLNTDCGCYMDSTGREYDKVQYKGDELVIQHVHEDPPSLSPK
jgi:hypothetical protein